MDDTGQRTMTSNVRLIHGDCLEIMPTLEAGSIDAVIADLPFGTTACAWDTVIPFAPLWAAYRRLLKPNGAVVLFGSQPFTSALVMSNPKWFRYEWIWLKRRMTGHLDAKRRPLKAHENILIFSEGQTTYNPQTIKSAKRMIGSKIPRGTACYGHFETGEKETDFFYPSSAVEFGHDPELSVTYAQRPNKDLRHPTQKPISLLTYLVLTYTNPGETVLDNTMGSGTCGVACVQTLRNFIGIESDEHFYCTALKRIHDAQAQGNLFDSDP